MREPTMMLLRRFALVATAWLVLAGAATSAPPANAAIYFGGPSSTNQLDVLLSHEETSRVTWLIFYVDHLCVTQVIPAARTFQGVVPIASVCAVALLQCAGHAHDIGRRGQIHFYADNRYECASW